MIKRKSFLLISICRKKIIFTPLHKIYFVHLHCSSLFQTEIESFYFTYFCLYYLYLTAVQSYSGRQFIYHPSFPNKLILLFV